MLTFSATGYYRCKIIGWGKGIPHSCLWKYGLLATIVLIRVTRVNLPVYNNVSCYNINHCRTKEKIPTLHVLRRSFKYLSKSKLILRIFILSILGKTKQLPNMLTCKHKFKMLKAI